MAKKNFAFLIPLSLLLLPIYLRIWMDHGFWNIDAAIFAGESIKMAKAMSVGAKEWLGSLWFEGGIKSPLIPWVGQFFFLVGHHLGTPKLAFMHLIFLSHVVTFILLYQLLKRLFCDKVSALFGCLILASSFTFVALSAQLLSEPIQLMVVVWVLYLSVTQQDRDRISNTLLLILAMLIGITTKISTPAYCVAPAVIILVSLIRSKEPLKWVFAKHTLYLLVIGLLLAAMTGWYAIHWERLVQHRGFAFFNTVWGSADPFAVKFIFWVKVLLKSLFLTKAIAITVGLWMVLGFVTKVTSSEKSNYDEATNRQHLYLGVSLFQILLYFICASATVNEIERFLLAIVPYAIILLVWWASFLMRKNSRLIFVLIFLAQFLFIHHAVLMGDKNDKRFLARFKQLQFVNVEQNKRFDKYNMRNSIVNLIDRSELGDGKVLVGRSSLNSFSIRPLIFHFWIRPEFYDLTERQLEGVSAFRKVEGRKIKKSVKRIWNAISDPNVAYYVDAISYVEKFRRGQVADEDYEYFQTIRAQINDRIERSGLYEEISIAGYQNIFLYKRK